MALLLGLLAEQIDMEGVVMLMIGVVVGMSLALGSYFYLWVRKRPTGDPNVGRATKAVCGVCDTQLFQDSLFCHECGAPIETQPAAQSRSPHLQYHRYLRRLDELRKTESIDDGIYLKLKKEFEEKRKRLGRSSGT